MSIRALPLLAMLAAVVLAAPLGAQPKPAAPSQRGSPRLMQGPMLGAVEGDGARLWVRLSGPYAINIGYGERPDALDRRSATVTARAEDDYTAIVRLEGLAPGRTYYYGAIEIDGRSPKSLARRPATPFRTAPAGPARFTVGFGSCAKSADDDVQPVWRQVSLLNPDLFLWLGDNVYANAVVPQIIAEEYRRQREITLRYPALRSIPQLAVWDDHDFGVGDGDRTNPVREGALTVFRQYWANPAGGLPDTPGVFFHYAYGGVDFFFLDERYYRDPAVLPDTPAKTILGPAQREWLRRGLKASRAPFKVLAGGSGWTDLRGPAGDSWAAYLAERAALFDFIRDENITGVLLLSGDMHQGQVNVIRRSEAGAYDLVEFVSSPLATENYTSSYTSPNEPGLRVPYSGGNNFGHLTFDLTAPDPTVTFQLYDAYGIGAYVPVRIRASQLRNGVSLWRELMDPALRAQHGLR
ncbi:MAG: alkaline phosphatase D family protein [Opitutaceae bacterium]|nr:alkaline phosphatase D family protein [Opitutaceae bacterium]